MTADRRDQNFDGASVPNARRPGRIELIDALRGVALIAMAIYHFTWDLEFFGYVERGLTGAGGWKLFARSIATSFLFLVGVSLVLAHGGTLRWRSFGARLLQVAAGAAIITAVTYVATPGGFVFFGILHQIALASLLGLAFLRLPFVVTALAGLAVIALPRFVETSLTAPKALAWIGLADRAPFSNDYVPLFPWFGVVLLGMAAAQTATRFDVWSSLRRLNGRLGRFGSLGFLGRRSLLFYLLHQPILIGLVWGFAQVSPPDPARIVRGEARRDCIASGRDAGFCKAYVGCVVTRLEGEALLRPYLDGLTTVDEDQRIRDMALDCSRPPQ